MSKPGFSFGLNLKKPGASKPAPPKRKTMFGGDDDSDNDANGSTDKPQLTDISELDDFTIKSPSRQSSKKPPLKSTNDPPSQPPNGKSKKSQISMFGDLSSSLESRKHQEAAEELDPSIYDYDAVYESLKPEKKATQEDVERKPKYMKNLIASAAVRKRDALIAEEKKIARERAEEGEEYADKEKFVTEAYKKQQEENRRIEEEERKREEEEAKKNKGGGMTAFYKDLLERGDQRHAEVVKAAEERAKAGPKEDEAQGEKVKTDADVAREINEKGGSIAINEEGQVVDKRLLLKGGLNLGATKKQEPRKETGKGPDRRDNQGQSRGFVGAGGKQAMRERQTRMLEAQLEQSLKRSMEEEEEERQKVERASKSRKTETDVSGARERYLARKKEAEEAKKKAAAEKS
ncbi:coiled-coil domain-containing protein 55-domain containing protein [Annulohypoxylon bovei var. microspora]|nr:coiled-coil domain-containing protein 55-domain containing protein [Annulohypoxylon bovei var. microspora]